MRNLDMIYRKVFDPDARKVEGAGVLVSPEVLMKRKQKKHKA